MNILDIGISFLVTIFIYLLYPLIRLFKSGKVGRKHARKIALINSLVCSTIFIIIRAIATGGNIIIINFAPAVLYYFIVKAILTDKSIIEETKINTKIDKQEDINMKENDDTINVAEEPIIEDLPKENNEIVCEYEYVYDEDNENQQTDESQINSIETNINDSKLGNEETIITCSKCGKPNDSDSSFCKFCGNKIIIEKTEEPKDLNQIKNNSSIKDLKHKIKNFQKLIKTFIVLIFITMIADLLFCAMYYSFKEPYMPSIYEAEEVCLSDLSIYDDTYFKTIDDVNYIYQVFNDEAKLYKFKNISRFSFGGKEQKGCATSIEIKDYFESHLKYGEPTFSFWSYTKGFFALGLLICLSFVAFIIIFMFTDRGMVKDLTRILLAKSETLKEWKVQFDRCEISYNEYAQKRKDLISRNILENSNYENFLFRFLY